MKNFSISIMAVLVLVAIFSGCASEEALTDEVVVSDETTAIVEVVEDSVEDAEEVDVVVELSGVNFLFSETEIRVNEGDTVRVVFTSEDGFHDWNVDEFDAATARVNTGATAEVTFIADQTGEFEYYCSVGQHRAMGMVGTLIVE